MSHKSQNIEQHLIQAVAQGDEKAFETLYLSYYKKLFSFLMKITHQEEELASDILQEAFLRVWINRDRLIEIENFQAWLYKVVNTEALTFIKKELHLKTKADRLTTNIQQSNVTFGLQKNIEFNEIKSIIAQAISQMPEQRQKIYILSREEGLSPDQISKELNISINTVYNTLTTALKQIRNELTAAGYGLYLSILILLNFF